MWHTYQNIVWQSPVSHEGSLGYCHNLDIQRHGIFAVISAPLIILQIATRADNVLHLSGELIGLRRVGPDIAPVLSFVIGIASANDFKHVLDDVLEFKS